MNSACFYNVKFLIYRKDEYVCETRRVLGRMLVDFHTPRGDLPVDDHSELQDKEEVVSFHLPDVHRVDRHFIIHCFLDDDFVW